MEWQTSSPSYRIQGLGEDDTEVMFAYDYGDRSHTEVAQKVKRVEIAPVAYSEYHRMHKVLSEDEEDDDVVHSPGSGCSWL